LHKDGFSIREVPLLRSKTISDHERIRPPRNTDVPEFH
jgi:hypothetical protein